MCGERWNKPRWAKWARTVTYKTKETIKRNSDFIQSNGDVFKKGTNMNQFRIL